MKVDNQTIVVGVKTDKFGPTVRVGEEWVKVATVEMFDKLVKGNSYKVEIQTNDAGKKKITNILGEEAKAEVKEPAYEKKIAETTKGEFRSPIQIMRSSAIGVALSFVAQSLQNDLETKYEDKEKLAFELAKKVEQYIEG